jgi:hypothetical protein
MQGDLEVNVGNAEDKVEAEESRGVRKQILTDDAERDELDDEGLDVAEKQVNKRAFVIQLIRSHLLKLIRLHISTKGTCT